MKGYIHKNKGVTLIELIVALAILTVVIGSAYSLNQFGSKYFSLGGDKSDIQTSLRLTANIITKETRNAEQMTLIDAVGIDSLLTGGVSFDLTKKYIYSKYDSTTNKYAVFSRALGVEKNLTGWMDGTLLVQYSRDAANGKVLKMNMSRVKGGQSFDLLPDVTLVNMSTGSIVDSSSGNIGLAVVFGPLSPMETATLYLNTLNLSFLTPGNPGNYSLPAADSNGNAIVWTTSTTTAPGITVSGTTATVTRGASSTHVTLTATINVFTPAVIHSYNFTVPASAPLALVPTMPVALPQGFVNNAYAPYDFSATGGTGSYTFASSTLPPGLTLSSSGRLTGTPTSATTYYPSVNVNDGLTSVTSPANASGYTLNISVMPINTINVTGETGNSVRKNQNLQMIKTVSPTNASYPAVTWSVDNTAYATINPTTGMLSAKNQKDVSVIVTATANYDTSIKGSVTISITN